MSRPRPAALVVALALGLVLAGCSPSSDEAAPAAAAPAAPAAPAAAPAETAAQAVEATANALAALSVDELRTRGNAALREQRLYSPAGDNAMEYYLAVRAKSATPDVSAESALMDLMPYALIAAEQAINGDDFPEAERLLELMARTDPEAPSLPRIREAIAAGRTAAEERTRLAEERARQAEDQRATAAAAATQQAAQQAAAQAAAPAPAPAPAAEPTPPPAATPAPVASAPAPAAAAPAPASPPRAAGAPRPISTPQPPYPRAAARSRASGMVVVQFTIGADGRVTDVSVLRSRPRGIFEDTVVDTVRTWRFEPTGEPVTLTRTFDFSM